MRIDRRRTNDSARGLGLAIVATFAVACGGGDADAPAVPDGSPSDPAPAATGTAAPAASAAADSEAPDVLADDGSAGLIVPEGALPEGVTLDQLTMTRLTNEAHADALEYELQPSGLAFEVPLILTTTIEDSGGRMPFVVAVDDEGEASVVDGVTLEYDVEADSVAVAAPIEHFSRYVISQAGVIEISTQSGLRAFAVGELFLFQVTIKYGDGYSNNVSDDKYLLEIYPASDLPFSVNPDGPETISLINGHISPSSFVIPTALNVKGSFVHEQVFECESDGPERLLDNDRIRVDFTASITISDINRTNLRSKSHAASVYLRLKDNYFCRGGGMSISPPPYTVICDNGKRFSGYGLTLADGRVIDSETKKVVTCN